MLLESVGGRVLGPIAASWTLVGMAAAVLIQGAIVLNWRRTVRREFMRHCYEMGVGSVLSIILTGTVVGLGLVLQALYWLGLFGQSDVVGRLIVLILVRELGPLSVGLLIVGRSATVMLSDLHRLGSDDRLRHLDAMGVDPFHYLVMTRVYAMALSALCLNVLFLGVALVVGHLAASLGGLTSLPLAEFIGDVLDNMGIGEFAISVLKPVLFGFTVALMTTALALGPTSADRTVHASLRELLPRGFAASMVAILLISALLSVLL
ncbi:MAG: ABC transporter permease [Gammaproteobacteria bacterium]|nr:ABC transporter permease [Gammaproteobacteria bacterium]